MKNVLRFSIVLGLVGVLLFAAPGTLPTTLAQQPEPDVEQEVLRIAKSLYCPVCPAVPLDACGTQACVQWRGLIRDKLLAGESEAQIRQYFIGQYGERVLGAPPPEGFNLSAYLVPVFVLLLGGLILFWTARTWRKRPAALDAPMPALHVSPEYAERISRELEARD